MKWFYKYIYVESQNMRFCFECEVCGKKIFGKKTPLICRREKTLIKCEIGKANKIIQRVFDHQKANSISLISLSLNQCRHCFRWVCDECFHCLDVEESCIECLDKKNKR